MDNPSPRPRRTKYFWHAAEELGLVSLYRSSLDTKLLCVQRFCRLFAYGGTTLVLVAYLSALGHSESRIGLFMTLTLAGDIVISFSLTLIAEGIGRRAILAFGALSMTASGVAFALSGNYWVLLTAAVLGVISPSANEIGPFRAVEESTLAYINPPEARSDIFAWYSLTGTAGTALGIMTCGWVMHALQNDYGWSQIPAYRVVFYAYAVLGLTKCLLAVTLSQKCELPRKPGRATNSESTPLMDNDSSQSEPRRSIFSFIGEESRVLVINLCLLFALDSFASGLAPMTWVVYFFRWKFGLEEGRLGSLFFTTSIIAAVSMLAASSIAKRFGNVKTMVFTHLPSAVALALIPVPSSLPFAMMFLILRSCTQSMDVAPRSAFLAAVIPPQERTVVLGTINVVKTGAQSLGPLITGVLVTHELFWVAFVAAGSLKATYDLGMLTVFVGHKTREERDREQETANP